jgi:hypothetical protein
MDTRTKQKVKHIGIYYRTPPICDGKRHVCSGAARAYASAAGAPTRIYVGVHLDAAQRRPLRGARRDQRPRRRCCRDAATLLRCPPRETTVKLYIGARDSAVAGWKVFLAQSPQIFWLRPTLNAAQSTSPV